MLLIYLEKFWLWASGSFRGVFDSCNCGSALRIILEFCTMKGDKRYMKAKLLVFLKKILVLGKSAIMYPIQTLKWQILVTFDLLWRRFKILHSKSGQQVHEDYILDFPKKISFRGNWSKFGITWHRKWCILSTWNMLLGIY